MDKLSKQPYEEFTVSSDFSKNMLLGETITGQSVSVVDKDGIDVSSTMTNQASVSNNGSQRVSVLVRAGAPESSPYKITFRCTTSIAHKWEHDVLMRVEEL